MIQLARLHFEQLINDQKKATKNRRSKITDEIEKISSKQKMIRESMLEVNVPQIRKEFEQQWSDLEKKK